ncbi:MAG TPA: nitroreductase family deazaflavin-dependent oxidoreductase [Deltaproteobacteria bacterium]|nr:nitroreductase family deazaflavin-dependent oxidoreductase [Deltaproteobacteria bacterium]
MEEATKKTGAPPPRWIMKLFTRLHVLVSELSGGRLWNTLGGDDVCFVGTVGRKTGRARTIPLMYVPHEDQVLLVASQGGAPKNPVWFGNLVAHPDITIRHGNHTGAFRARLAKPEEKDALWPICDRHYAPFAEYRTRTTRDIPIFICSPRD